MGRLTAHRILATALAFVLVAAIGPVRPAHAQTRDDDLLQLDDDALRADGWQFRDEAFEPGSVAGGILAVTAGSVFHGAGHLFVGDEGTWVPLVLAELTSIAFVAAGVTLAAQNPNTAVEPLGEALAVTGVSTFVASWAIDVLGAFKGTGSELPKNTVDPRGLSAEVMYSVLVVNGTSPRNIASLSVPLRTTRLHLVPTGEVSTELAIVRGALDVEWREPLTDRGTTTIGLGVTAAEEWFSTDHVGRSRGEVRAVARLDIGEVFPHLGGLIWQNHVGLAADWWSFAADGYARFRAANRTVTVPAGFLMTMNVNPGVNLTGGYEHRRDEWVGAIGRHAGYLWGRIRVTPRGRIGLDLRLDIGAHVRAWAGLRWSLAGGRDAR